MNLIRLMAIIKKEFIHVFRDKPSLIIAIMMPIVFVILFGYAVNMDVDNIPMAVLDMDKTTESRALINSFENSNYFIPTEFVASIDEIEKLINSGEVRAAVIIPNNFSKAVNGYDEKSVQLIIDGVDPTVAKTAMQSGNLVSKMYFAEISGGSIVSSNVSVSGSSSVDVRTKVWYNPNLESTKFTIPGLIGLIVQNITIMLTAFSLVREKEKGTLELLIVTPIKSAELILGKMVPYIFIGTFDLLVTMALGTVWFNVPIQGSVFLLCVLGVVFVMCSLAIGMLISTVADSQGQAMQMTIGVLLPSILLSGFVFPRDAMPLVINLVGNFIPLTYFLNILRGIILKGVGLEYLMKDVVLLSLFTIGLLTLASVKFKKRLD